MIRQCDAPGCSRGVSIGRLDYFFSCIGSKLRGGNFSCLVFCPEHKERMLGVDDNDPTTNPDLNKETDETVIASPLVQDEVVEEADEPVHPYEVGPDVEDEDVVEESDVKDSDVELAAAEIITDSVENFFEDGPGDDPDLDTPDPDVPKEPDEMELSEVLDSLDVEDPNLVVDETVTDEIEIEIEIEEPDNDETTEDETGDIPK